MSDSHPNPNRWWFHRRMMAYISLAALIGLMAGMITNRVPTELLPLAQTLAWVFCANLLYYYGGNAVEALKDKR